MDFCVQNIKKTMNNFFNTEYMYINSETNMLKKSILQGQKSLCNIVYNHCNKLCDY